MTDDHEARTKVLDESALLKVRQEPSFDRITLLARDTLGVPISLITLLDRDRQVFISSQGLGDPWRTMGETPLSHSFCQHVVRMREPLIVPDARCSPLVALNPAINDIGVVAYLGVPLTLGCGTTVGALCVIDGKPRAWTENDEKTLTHFAALVVGEIELRQAVRREEKSRVALSEQTRQFELAFSSIGHGICFFDRETRLITANESYAAIYRLSEERLRPGMTFADIMESRRLVGTTPKLNQTYFLDWVRSPGIGELKTEEFELQDGRLVRIMCKTTSCGGWVATNEDVTERRRLQMAVADSEWLYRLLAENANDVVILGGLDGKRTYFSPAVTRLFGYSVDEALATPLRDLIHQDELPTLTTAVAALSPTNAQATVVHRVRCKDGRYIWAETALRLFVDGGQQTRYVCTVRDVSKRTAVEDEYRQLFENANVGLFRMRHDGRLLKVNKALAGIWGYQSIDAFMAAAAMAETRWQLEPERFQIFNDAILQSGGVTDFPCRIRRADGGEAFISKSAWLVPSPDGRETVIEGSVFDVTERMRSEERVRKAALTDALTDLPNREYLQKALGDTPRPHKRTLLYMDLDRFKPINDRFGHEEGDNCLRQLAQRFRDVLAPHDHILARIGGDEFAVMLSNMDAVDASEIAAQLIAKASYPITLANGHTAELGISIGLVGLTPTIEGSEALRHADIAMYAAKSAGRSRYSWYDDELERKARYKAALDHDLRLALARNEFHLVFQPQVELSQERSVGFEALLRWHHPIHGLVSPLDFIPVAEATGLIHDIGLWVIDRALLALADMPQELTISMNVSAVQLQSPSFLGHMVRLISDRGADPRRIEIEITESLLVTAGEETRNCIDGLRELGISIAIDDFGTGYSSLSYLASFPFDVIKIDRSFIADLSSTTSQQLLHSIIGLGGSIGKKIIVEGVETATQATTLISMGARFAQGFYYGRPMRLQQAIAEGHRSSALATFCLKENAA